MIMMLFFLTDDGGNGVFLGVMITTMMIESVFLPILVIFSSAFRVIASSPLLSDLIQGVCNDITVFTEYYSAKYTFGHINA